jgi:DNA repair exonuclease SbcCD nuclease subunit
MLQTRNINNGESNILFITDLHFKTNNVPQCEEFIDKILKLSKKKKPDFVVIGGDLLHTHERLHVDPFNLCNSLVKQLSMLFKVYILVGNHDYINNAQFLSENHWMNCYKEWSNVNVIDKPKYIMNNGCEFVFMPYVPNGRFIEALKTIENDVGKGYFKNVHCIFAHQEFHGCNLGTTVSENGDHWDKTYSNIISGHIHKNQRLHNIYYPGSIMQHTFGEESNQIVPYLTFEQKDKKTYKKQEIQLHLAKKISIEMNMSEIRQFKQDVKKNKHDEVRIIVSGSLPEFKQLKKTKKYRELIEKNVKLVFKPIQTNDIQDVSKKENKHYDYIYVLNHLIANENDSELTKVHNNITSKFLL